MCLFLPCVPFRLFLHCYIPFTDFHFLISWILSFCFLFSALSKHWHSLSLLLFCCCLFSTDNLVRPQITFSVSHIPLLVAPFWRKFIGTSFLYPCHSFSPVLLGPFCLLCLFKKHILILKAELLVLVPFILYSAYLLATHLYICK